MKKIAVAILIVLSTTLFGQSKKDQFDMLFISYYRADSMLAAEIYKLKFKNKKVYRITPVINYLDIQNVKYQTRVKVQRKYWKEIVCLSDTLYSLCSNANMQTESDLAKASFTMKYYKKDIGTVSKLSFNENEAKNLIRLFEIIRAKN